jgi:hypothetical protein
LPTLQIFELFFIKPYLLADTTSLPTSVPEPSAVLGLGLLGLGTFGATLKRKKKVEA